MSLASPGAAASAARHSLPDIWADPVINLDAVRAAGAEVSWSGCNPLSTQDDIAAALATEGTSIYAWHGLTKDARQILKELVEECLGVGYSL